MTERYLIAADSREMAVFGRRSSGVLPVRLALSEPTPAALIEACATALTEAGLRPGSANVWLGSAWARLLMLDWPDTRLDLDEREALLRHRWADVLPDPERWTLLVAERGSPRLGVAIREGLAEGLARQLGHFHLRARSLLPAVCGALDACRIREGAVLLDEGDRAVSARCESGQIVALSVRRRVADEPTDDSADLSVTAGDPAPRRLGGPGFGAGGWGTLWQ